MYKDGMSQEERQRRMAMVVRLRDDWRNVSLGLLRTDRQPRTPPNEPHP